jgi:two-component system sensor kinase FixL
MSDSGGVTQQDIIADLRNALQQNALLQADRFYLASIVEYSTDAIVAQDMEGRITTCNRAALELFGYDREEIVGAPVAILIPPDHLQDENEIMDRIRSGDLVAQYATRRVCKDGSLVPVSLTASPIRNDAGHTVGASQIMHDTTDELRAREELRALQAELVHLSRWNMMGMMASSLAHELNQPLTAMLNYVRAARRMLDAGASVAAAGDYLDKAVEETKLAGGIIRSLREFIQKRETSRGPCDINDVLEESLVLSLYVGAEGRERIATAFAPDLPLVLVDRVQIQQVVLNLVRNALESARDLPGASVEVATEMGEPGFVRVSVSDTGPGLAPEIASRLFQPFATTKEQGMGVGLSICQSIVEWHGGRIWMEPNAPNGVIFRFQLPVADGAAP